MKGSGLVLVADRISLAFGRRYILRDIAFRAVCGEVIALVGPNGAGKTTLLSVLCGRLRPDQGTVRLDGDDPSRCLVGLVPHDLFLYPDLTTRENLAFFAALHGTEDAPIAAVIESVGLSRDLDRPVRTLSRGMQQRAAIGRLLVTRARVWLLDEPATGLDESGRAWFASTVAQAARDGVLVIMATHFRDEVESATRVIALESGRIVGDGPGGTGQRVG